MMWWFQLAAAQLSEKRKQSSGSRALQSRKEGVGIEVKTWNKTKQNKKSGDLQWHELPRRKFQSRTCP